MRIIDRLNEYIEFKGLNYNKVTVECKLSNGLLHNAYKSDGDISRSTIEKILDAYRDINRNWLMYGEGEMIIDDMSTIQVTKSSSPDITEMTSRIENLERRIDELLKQNGELIAMLVKKS